MTKHFGTLSVIILIKTKQGMLHDISPWECMLLCEQSRAQFRKEEQAFAIVIKIIRGSSSSGFSIGPGPYLCVIQ